MIRYKVRQEPFGSVIYDVLKHEYLFADEGVTEALMVRSAEGLTKRIPPSAATARDSFFNVDGMPQYEILKTVPLETTRTILSAPLQVYYDCTTACDLRCRHCYTSSAHATDGELSLSELTRWGSELSANGVFKISIGGGEPLKLQDAVERIAVFTARGMSVSLSTNALSLTAELIDRLNDLRLRTLSVSLEGATQTSYEAIRGPGTWRIFERALALLAKRYRNRLSFRVTITRQTVFDVKRILDLAQSVGAYSVKFKLLQFEGRTLENPDIVPSGRDSLDAISQALTLDPLYAVRVSVPTLFSLGTQEHAVNRYRVLSANGESPYVRPFGCGGGHTGLYIHPDGTYSACVSMGASYHAGNLRSTSLSHAWRRGIGVRRMRALSASPECDQCLYLRSCKGGCRARAFHLLGDPNAIDPYCPFHKPVTLSPNSQPLLAQL